MSNDNSLPTVVGADLCNVLSIASQRIGNTVSDMDYQFHVIQRIATKAMADCPSGNAILHSALQDIVNAANAGRAAKKTIAK